MAQPASASSKNSTQPPSTRQSNRQNATIKKIRGHKVSNPKKIICKLRRKIKRLIELFYRIRCSVSITSIYSTKFTIARTIFSSKPPTHRSSRMLRIWTLALMGSSQVLKEIQMEAQAARGVPFSTV